MPGQPDDDTHTLDQYHDHTATISAAVNRWRVGELSGFSKRQAIAEENRRYYGGPRKSPVTGEALASMPRSDDVANTLADAACVPPELMRSALRARHRASVMAQELLDGGGTNEAARSLVTEGLAAFQDIVGTGLLAWSEPVTREQLEATAWQLAHRLTSPDPQERNDAMDDLLQAADAYACHTGGITAERRAVLAGRLP